MEFPKNMLGLGAFVYLRKSRMEEGLETAEVLSKHHQALDECAQRHGLVILEYFSVVVSGKASMPAPRCSASWRLWRPGTVTLFSVWTWTGSPAGG